MAQEDKAAAILQALEVAGAAHGVDVLEVELVGATKAPTVRVRLDWMDEAKARSRSTTLRSRPSGSPRSSTSSTRLRLFTLEVSSPGLDRPLRRERDFERFAGEQVALTTKAVEGRKRFSGKLVGMRDGLVVIDTDDGEQTFALDEIRRCAIKPTFAKGEKKTFDKSGGKKAQGK